MRIAVTGASGRIGGQVVRLLAAEQPHQVVALSRRGLLPGVRIVLDFLAEALNPKAPAWEAAW